MNILDYLPLHIPICKQTFFLTEGETIDIGDVFFQDGSKLFVLRKKSENDEKNPKTQAPHHNKNIKKNPFPRPIIKGFQKEGGSYSKHQSEFAVESEFFEMVNPTKVSKAHDLGGLPTFLLIESEAVYEESNNKQDEESVVLDEHFVTLLAGFEQKDISHINSNHSDHLHPEEELVTQFFEHFDELFFEELDEDIESINDFEDWLVIDLEILMKKDNITLLNCYAMPFCFWDIVLESFLIYELEGYVPSVAKLIERLKHLPPEI